MKRINRLYGVTGIIFLSTFVLSGCVVRSYQMTKDRVDQDMTAGNKGFLQGTAPTPEMKDKKTTRTTQVVEVEFGSPIKFEGAPKEKLVKPAPVVIPQEEPIGNRGYVNQSFAPEAAEAKVSPPAGYETYKIEKGDTLQKISRKFTGTTKNWYKIYKANTDVLKGPDKIIPGKEIKIPQGLEAQKAEKAQKKAKAEENLK